MKNKLLLAFALAGTLCIAYPAHGAALEVGPLSTFLADAASGNLQKVKDALDSGTSPNCADAENKMTALHYAASNGQIEVVQLLLDRGADPLQEGAPVGTPLEYAQKFAYPSQFSIPGEEQRRKKIRKAVRLMEKHGKKKKGSQICSIS